MKRASIKHLFVTFSLLVLSAYSHAQSPKDLEIVAYKDFGVNYNGLLNQIDDSDLQRTNTKIVRGFIDFFKYFNNPALLDTDPRISEYLLLKSKGYTPALNIKWAFHSKSFPEPNSAELAQIESFLVTILDKVWDQTDILVVGNEPFIEALPAERNQKLVDFYSAMVAVTVDYKNESTHKPPLYVGAFNNLQQNRWLNEAEGLLALAKNNPAIAGVDLHIHHANINVINQVMARASARIRTDQKMIVTEFSLMKHFKSNLNKVLDAQFAQKYAIEPSTRVFEYIDSALKNPVSRLEWVDFFRMSPWYNNRAGYLTTAFNRMNSFPQFNFATYAIRQSFPFNQDFTVNTDPWVLNGIYVNRSVVPNPNNGLVQFNYRFIDTFRAVRNNAQEERFMIGDLNRDGDIDRNDIQDFLAMLRTNHVLDTKYDFNFDGRVSSLDLRLLFASCSQRGCR